MDGLISHSGSHPTTLPALYELPKPERKGARHRPVPHFELVESIRQALDKRGLTVADMRLAVSEDGAKMFGVIDVTDGGPGWRRQLGFRNSTDESMAIRGVAGRRVLVCDNMALSGDEFSFAHKNTSGLKIADLTYLGMSRWEEQTKKLSAGIDSLTQRSLTDDGAKAVIYDAMISEAVPKALLGPINENYFAPEPTEDCAPRNAWGLHNAFTRALKTMKNSGSMFQRTIDVGKHFGI